LRPGLVNLRASALRGFIFGQSLLFLERGPRKRAHLIARSVEKLLDEQG
jgi:hypothetical protein